MYLKKSNFFETPLPSQDPQERPEVNEAPKAPPPAPERAAGILNDERLAKQIQILDTYCREAGRSDLIDQIASIREYLASAKFTVAVVGEFNRGKSTLVNQLIERDIIPTSALPTTTLPIRVTGDKDECIIWRDKNEEKQYPLAEESWEKIKQKNGEIRLQRNCGLLLQHDLEIIDTPGVNSQIRGDITMAEKVLGSCDCAILPMAAVAAFSESEKLFLEERILMKKIPRIMVVLTKLDLLTEADRLKVVESVQNQLDSIDAKIPLYLSADGFVPGWEDRSGPEAIRKQILAWLHESNHAILKKERAYQSLGDIGSDLAAVYTCELEILAEKEEKRKEAAAKKKQELLNSSKIQWDTLEIQMLERCNKNFEWLQNMTQERQEDILERLLLDLSHTGNPKEWWERDYPYRIKVELVSLENTLEGSLQNFYTRDVGWLNHTLQEQYGMAVPPQNQRMAEHSIFRNPLLQEEVDVEDMKRSRIISRVGTGVATVAGYLMFGTIGLSPFGMAIGIGGGIVSEIFMNKRVEVQKQKLTQVISEELPGVFSSCIESVEKRVRQSYSSIIYIMKQSCASWANAKCEAIEAAQKLAGDPKREEALRRKLDTLKKIGNQ